MLSNSFNVDDNIGVPNISEEDLKGPNREHAKPKWFKIKKTFALLFLSLHVAGLYGIYLAVTGAPHWKTICFNILMYYVSVVGITAGVHRLWSHRAFKATLPLQVLLMVMSSVAFQYSAITWVREHRTHHKFSDTDADPHNSSRGFFFSHIGWTMLERHPEVKRLGRTVDLSDVHNNPILKFQHDNYNVIGLLAGIIIPSLIPLLWGELLWVSWHLNIARFLTITHVTCLINSAAHKWGNKPYDKNIAPTQNIPLVLASLGEGYHNYHHTFPFDYRASEIGNTVMNPTTMFIELCARAGWAHDLRSATPALVRARAKRTGDGTMHGDHQPTE